MAPKKVRCPNCKAPSAWEDNPWRPFCSERCRLLDLGQWLSGNYAIPGEKAESQNSPNSEDSPDSEDSEDSDAKVIPFRRV